MKRYELVLRDRSGRAGQELEVPFEGGDLSTC